MDGIFEVLAGGLLALAGVLISQFFEYKKRRSEEKRWFAQYFLGLRIDALKKLQISLEEINKRCHIYGNIGAKSREEFQREFFSYLDEYRTSIRMAIIYLNKDQQKIFENAYGEFILVSHAIEKQIRPPWFEEEKAGQYTCPQVDWKGLVDSYKDAVESLKELLNPSNLREYIEKI